MRRSALQLHSLAVVDIFPGRDYVRGVGKRIPRVPGVSQGVSQHPLCRPKRGIFKGDNPFAKGFPS